VFVLLFGFIGCVGGHMKTDLKNYIQVFENIVSSQICDTSVELLKNSQWQQHEFYNANTQLSFPRSCNKELDISWQPIATHEEIMNCVYVALAKYVGDLQFSWFNGWVGYSRVRFNRYEEQKLMALHCDHIRDMFPGEPKGIPILSIVGSLNDGYQGGEFIMFDDFCVELPKGAIMIFPSNFLYPHFVRPVTKGVRHTFVSWAY